MGLILYIRARKNRAAIIARNRALAAATAASRQHGGNGSSAGQARSAVQVDMSPPIVQAVARAVPAPVAPQGSVGGIAEQLSELAKMHQQGILNHQEYEAAKSQLLGTPTPMVAQPLGGGVSGMPYGMGGMGGATTTTTTTTTVVQAMPMGMDASLTQAYAVDANGVPMVQAFAVPTNQNV
uniref:SHOCT domain-containing protein n=1 Tax=Haptolina brevifila TaxID=156173 RepID=A0A7S2GY03_9EUKA|mmetsp:Transcript_48876/g.97514  ORF Transcript_48876/g.97514 Transcript_48876/m.97514 type:complete len:181 (+) Transcript_48876:303-845(+)